MHKRAALMAGALAMLLTAGFLATALNKTAEAQIGNPPVSLFTPPLTVEEVDASGSGVEFRCHLVNVTAQSRSVRIRIKNQVGTVVEDSGSQTLGAGDIMQLRTQILDNGVPGHASPPLYCHFTTSGSKTDVRGDATIGSRDLNSYSDMVAVSAQ